MKHQPYVLKGPLSGDFICNKVDNAELNCDTWYYNWIDVWKFYKIDKIDGEQNSVIA